MRRRFIKQTVNLVPLTAVDYESVAVLVSNPGVRMATTQQLRNYSLHCLDVVDSSGRSQGSLIYVSGVPLRDLFRPTNEQEARDPRGGSGGIYFTPSQLIESVPAPPRRPRRASQGY